MESNQVKKQRAYIKYVAKRIKSDYFTRRNREKANFDIMIISHFGFTYNIFADCMQNDTRIDIILDKLLYKVTVSNIYPDYNCS